MFHFFRKTSRIYTRNFQSRPPFSKIYPNCAECIHYIQYKFDAYSRCGKFEIENPITEEKDFEYADYARRNESQCGYDARYYIRGKTVRHEK